MKMKRRQLKRLRQCMTPSRVKHVTNTLGKNDFFSSEGFRKLRKQIMLAKKSRMRANNDSPYS